LSTQAKADSPWFGGLLQRSHCRKGCAMIIPICTVASALVDWATDGKAFGSLFKCRESMRHTGRVDAMNIWEYIHRFRTAKTFFFEYLQKIVVTNALP